jgi:hypothetical protein
LLERPQTIIESPFSLVAAGTGYVSRVYALEQSIPPTTESNVRRQSIITLEV